jgi:hypothetical protein
MSENLSDKRSKREENLKRRMQVFRVLMATRSITLNFNHVEALNLVEVEFYNDSKVMECWRQYRIHLDDQQYIKRDVAAWDKDRNKLLVDMLYEMSIVLGYTYVKSEIQKGVYYPSGYANTENEAAKTRTLWLEILEGKRQIPMKAEVWTNQPPVNNPPGQTVQPAEKK